MEFTTKEIICSSSFLEIQIVAHHVFVIIIFDFFPLEIILS